jgi:hypothetical protein
LSLTPVAPATYPVSLSLNAPWDATFTLEGEGGAGWFAIKCDSATGTGKLTSGTSGEMKITYKGCNKSNLCTSVGQPSGNMVTSNLAVTPVYLNATKTIWGFKLTPIGTSVFAECNLSGGGFLKFTGSVMGTIGYPVGSTTKELNLHFEMGSVWQEQRYQQIEGAGTKYHLSMESAGFGGPSFFSNEVALWHENPITSGASLKINP